MTFGQRLMIARENAGLKQCQLANHIGTLYGNVSNWENDKRKPSFDNIIKLCRVLKCSSDVLLGLRD